MAFVERYRSILGKVHITRILGTNKAGDILPDMWADVERVENFTFAIQLFGRYQEVIFKLRWRDNPDDTTNYRAEDDASENENMTSSATVVVKVCSPDEADLNDPQEWIPVRVIKRLRMLEGGEGGMTSKQFLSDQLAKDLGVRLRRIYHYDTSMDDKAEAAFDADPTRKAYVEKAHLYAKDDETKDDGQYIECEIVTRILKFENAHERSSGADQKTYVKLKNQYLIDESEPAELKEVGNDDKNPPYRLDAFQNIVNVNLGGGAFVAGNVMDVFAHHASLECLYTSTKKPQPDPVWTSAQIFGGAHQFGLYCGVYGEPKVDNKAVPTFLLAGNDTTFDEEGTFTFHSFIVMSTDNGKTWTRTYSVARGFAVAAAYDKETKLFYVQHVNQDAFGPFFNVVTRSANGASWTEVERVPAGVTNYASPLLLNASSDLYKDADGHNCPGGVYGYDKGTHTVIAPHPDIHAFKTATRESGTKIQIIKRDKDGAEISRTTKTIAGMAKISSVTFKSGIWMASGNNGADAPKAKIARSIDSGETWQIEYEPSVVGNAVVVLAGKLKP